MSLEAILTGGGSLLLVCMTLVQIAPIKVNPWSWLGGFIGRVINADVSKRLDVIEKKLDAHVTMDDRRMAESHRTRILHFNNELLRDIGHTHEEFREVLAEIDDYEEYCASNPDYPNNRAVLAIENIREVYKERMKRRDFLHEGCAPRQEQRQ